MRYSRQLGIIGSFGYNIINIYFPDFVNSVTIVYVLQIFRSYDMMMDIIAYHQKNPDIGSMQAILSLYNNGHHEKI